MFWDRQYLVRSIPVTAVLHSLLLLSYVHSRNNLLTFLHWKSNPPLLLVTLSGQYGRRIIRRSIYFFFFFLLTGYLKTSWCEAVVIRTRLDLVSLSCLTDWLWEAPLDCSMALCGLHIYQKASSLFLTPLSVRAG